MKMSHIPSISGNKHISHYWEASSQTATGSEEMAKSSSSAKSSNVLNDAEFENEGKSSQTPSTLDRYCTTDILNESSDFVDSEPKNKFRNNSKRKVELFLCEICKDDITDLDVYSRGVHVNKCIDKQLSCPSDPPTQSPENEVVFILECPLCFRNFPSPEVRSTHIKKCGKSKGLGTQSIIKALALQERHVLEREALGLPIKPSKPIKPQKSTNKRAAVEPKSKTQSDMQLAKALSLSLTNTNQAASNDDGVSTAILQAPSAEQIPGKKPTKHKRGSVTPLLVLRSEEDRKKLLLDRVASILAPVNENDVRMDVEEAASFEKLDRDPTEKPVLWGLSSKSSQKYDYYVEQLLNWIQPSDIEVGAKLGHLSQIAGHEILTQLPVDYTFSSQNDNDTSASVSKLFPTMEQSVPSVIGCLRSLVASSWMSDVDIHTACGSVIPAHKLLLAIRCPPLKQDLHFCSSSERIILKWNNISFDVALQFLNFVYSGNIDITEDMVVDLLHLAKKYQVSDLEEYLNSKWKSHCASASEINVKSFLATDREDTSLSFNSSPQVVKAKDNPLPYSQENANPDLDIVYNCINSSMRPTQFLTQPSYSTSPGVVASPEKHDILREGLISPMLVDNSDNENVLVTVVPAKETDFDIKNTSLQEDYHTSSPVVFDVNDSDDDMSDNENSDPENSFPQRLTEEEPTEMDLVSSKSNSSEDSVKFLKTSLHSSMSNDPDDTSTSNIFGSQKISRSSAISTDSPLKGQITQSNNSRTFLKVSPVRTDSKDISFQSSEQHSDVSTTLESLNLPHSTSLLNFSMQNNDDIVKNSLTLNDGHTTKTRSTCFEDNVIKISDDSLDSTSDVSHSSNLKESENEVANNDDNCNSVVEKADIKLENDFIHEELSNEQDDSFLLSLSQRLFCTKSHSHNDSAVQGFKEYSPSKKREVSQEVLLCDSNNEGSSSPKLESFSSSHIVSNIDNTCSIEKARDNVASPEVICFTSDSEPTPLEESTLLPKESSSVTNGNMDETVPFSGDLSENDNLHETDSINMSKASLQSIDDFVAEEPYAYLEPDFSFLEDKLTSLHSSGSSGGADRPNSVDADNGLSEFKECTEPNASSVVCSMTQSKTVTTDKSKQKTRKKIVNMAGSPASKLDNLKQNIRFSDSPITPLPDYRNMVTPDIKQALKRYGVKAMPRKKAVAMLTHIYDETHPLLNGEIPASSTMASPKKVSKGEKITKPRKRKIAEGSEKPAKKTVPKEVVHPNGISLSSDSEDSNSENSEAKQLGYIPEISFSQCSQDSPTKNNADDIELIKNYILSNEQLYSDVLNYKPMNMVELQQELKNNGIKISVQKLMDFLDEQCITFTCPRKEEHKKKQTARANRFRKKMIAKMSQQQAS